LVGARSGCSCTAAQLRVLEHLHRARPDPLPKGGLVYRWNGYEKAGSIHSLLRYVETHGDRLRAKYLALIHEVGERRIDGKRIIDHLALEDGLSC
jgi:hypothetical protein